MNIEKAKKYFEDRIELLERQCEEAINDAQTNGSMCYEDRMRRDEASRRLVNIGLELDEINNILGG